MARAALFAALPASWSPVASLAQPHLCCQEVQILGSSILTEQIARTGAGILSNLFLIRLEGARIPAAQPGRVVRSVASLLTGLWSGAPAGGSAARASCI